MIVNIKVERAGGEHWLDFLTGCQYLSFFKIIFDNLFGRVESRRWIDAPPYPLPLARGRGQGRHGPANKSVRSIPDRGSSFPTGGEKLFLAIIRSETERKSEVPSLILSIFSAPEEFSRNNPAIRDSSAHPGSRPAGH